MSLSMFKHVIASSEIFDTLKDRWLAFQESDFENADPLIIRPCILFNQLPDVVTVFSCEGHEDESHISSPYYMLACSSEQGLENIFKVWNTFIQLLIERQQTDLLHQFGLKFCNRILPFGENVEIIWYPVIVLSTNFAGRGYAFTSHKALFNQTLVEACETVLSSI